MINIGQEFVVNEVVDFKENEVIHTRYNPHFVYKVTKKNIDFVKKLFEDKRIALKSASLGGIEKHVLDSDVSELSAKVTMGEKPKTVIVRKK